MRTGYFYSLVFALLTSASVATIAAPAAKPEVGNTPLVQEVSPKAQSGKVDLNAADAPTLQRELSGIGEAKAKAITADQREIQQLKALLSSRPGNTPS